jgi:hypothetical protein
MVPKDWQTSAVLAEWRAYWVSRGDAKTEAEWMHKFLQHLIAEKVRAASGKSTISGAGVDGKKRDEFDAAAWAGAAPSEAKTREVKSYGTG